jgi:hypothetical protein
MVKNQSDEKRSNSSNSDMKSNFHTPAFTIKNISNTTSEKNRPTVQEFSMDNIEDKDNLKKSNKEEYVTCNLNYL